LTGYELRLLPVLTTGESLNDIAQRLELPRRRVLSGADSIYRKLGVWDGLEAVAQIIGSSPRWIRSFP
jgi:DNA-binding NarL/FixJ family response regulator